MRVARKLKSKIVVLDRDDYNHAHSSGSELLTDPETTVVPVPMREDEETDELTEIADLLQPGALLIRNRWQGDAFMHAAEAHELLSVGKFLHIADLCQLLGAVRLEVSEIRQVDVDGKAVGKVKFKAGVVSGEGTGETEWLRGLAQSIQGRWEWDGSAADPDAATEYVGAFGLARDPIVRSLIQQRRDIRNRLGRQRLELDIATEAQRAIRSALTVEPVLKKLGLTSFHGTFDMMRKRSNRVVLTIEIDFGQGIGD